MAPGPLPHSVLQREKECTPPHDKRSYCTLRAVVPCYRAKLRGLARSYQREGRRVPLRASGAKSSPLIRGKYEGTKGEVLLFVGRLQEALFHPLNVLFPNLSRNILGPLHDSFAGLLLFFCLILSVAEFLREKLEVVEQPSD